MKTITIEKSKKFEHIVGAETKETYEYVSSVGKLIDSLEIDGETYDNHQEEIEAIYNLENGTHYIDAGDFNIYVEIKDQD